MEDASPSNHPDPSRRTVLRAGIATVGAVGLGVAASSAVAAPAVAEDAAKDTTADTAGAHGSQSNWRWCYKCEGLWFNGHPTNGRCPAGGVHSSQGSLNYTLSFS